MEKILPVSQEFRNACSYLNKYNLSDLWKVSSILSCIDKFDTSLNGFSLLFPVLNFVAIALFDKAILHSSARDYKTLLFDSKKLPRIFNALKNFKNTDELTDELYDQSKEPETRILSFIAKIANSQFQYQTDDFGIQVLRAYALYEDIPNAIADQLKTKHKSNYVNIPKAFKDEYHISIKNYLIFGWTLVEYYTFQSQKHLAPGKEVVDKIIKLKNDKDNSNNYKTKLLLSLINKTHIRDEFCFDIHDLLIKLSEIKEAETFLSILSNTSKELSSLQGCPPYNIGQITYRLSPLERYPIIRLNDSRYIIPNIRYFLTFFTPGFV